MADIAKSGTPSLASLHPDKNSLPSLVAGEDLGAGDACYIKSDGKVWKSTGAADNAAAKVHGYAPVTTKTGQQVSLHFNVRFRYGSGLTPGINVFLSGATAGALADAASTGGLAPIGFVVDTERIQLFASRY